MLSSVFFQCIVETMEVPTLLEFSDAMRGAGAEEETSPAEPSRVARIMNGVALQRAPEERSVADRMSAVSGRRRT